MKEKSAIKKKKNNFKRFKKYLKLEKAFFIIYLGEVLPNLFNHFRINTINGKM